MSARTGLVRGMDATEYHSGPEVSNTILSTLPKALRRSQNVRVEP